MDAGWGLATVHYWQNVKVTSRFQKQNNFYIYLSVAGRRSHSEKVSQNLHGCIICHMLLYIRACIKNV